MNSLSQMSLVTRNFCIFFGNTLPTCLQRQNLSKVLDHSQPLHNSSTHCEVYSCAQEHYLYKQEKCPQQLYNAMALLRFSVSLLRLVYVLVFILVPLFMNLCPYLILKMI